MNDHLARWIHMWLYAVYMEAVCTVEQRWYVRKICEAHTQTRPKVLSMKSEASQWNMTTTHDTQYPVCSNLRAAWRLLTNHDSSLSGERRQSVQMPTKVSFPNNRNQTRISQGMGPVARDASLLLTVEVFDTQYYKPHVRSRKWPHPASCADRNQCQ